MICHDCGEAIRHTIDSQTREVGGKAYSWCRRCWNLNRWRETFALGEEEKRLEEDNGA